MEITQGEHTVGFADYKICIIEAESEDLFEDEIKLKQELLETKAKAWLDSKGLAMAVHKTEAELVTRRRIFRSPRLIIDIDGTQKRVVIKTNMSRSVSGHAFNFFIAHTKSGPESF